MGPLMWTLLAAGVTALTIAGSVLVNLAASELYDWAPTLADKIIWHAATRFDTAEHRSRYDEQWRADIRTVPGHLTALAYAIRIWIGSFKTADEVNVPRMLDKTIMRKAVWLVFVGCGLWLTGSFFEPYAQDSKLAFWIFFVVSMYGNMAVGYALYLRTKLYKRSA